jgi:hypothetical protein
VSLGKKYGGSLEVASSYNGSFEAARAKLKQLRIEFFDVVDRNSV